MNSTYQLDKKYLKRCFILAKKGAGKVSPNPLVGAVIVKSGIVIGEGWHNKYGDSHAEVNAITNAKVNISGATLYCNLEPCCHSKKQTPPCVPLLIENKISRVVISNIDPNKEVNGRGIRQLKNAGIQVSTGISEQEGQELNKYYFKYVSKKIPYISIKIAQSIDGKISESKNKQTWLTGEKSVKYVHKLRSVYDAVLVGANTIKTDDPQLTVRKVKGRNPIRIIIDGKLSISLKSKVIETDDTQNTWIFTSKSSNKRKVKSLTENGVKVFQLKSNENNSLSLKKILNILTKEKITSLLVEGGADIFTQFIQKELFDELIVLQSPNILGRGIYSQNIQKLKKLELLSTSKLGEDIKLVYGKN
ncbi:MAG: bifunctional diaminohydroxyphosphoribosylaminopyrimidine deaminase/5-amino-6-(5-phosphoribosylamino)uracil reductase RibD [Ignavibacteria bacterium]|nr:bifunctional diaminohydroxyphosphoribosylaminopyrimidine deaminase/5-amino-6-(5-phosphoribosylamino)uracil reductase RibD [Ignavibacteria bacterium]MBT8380829.1 bifunctional diaminohydroxyphosphoribosylaminopyrimidine deaminase/5-amino-6-(5-phosphoribosylamino)uracil reductase RibD [Ignavibacteria bacterium]MBT8393021.1 bifunctional diaminohydroxyphosphoribosylaminopyrimidine deaminase/5-amino-6-(5-phosphoribosylamino)uracil reductase RibD [Ignavibacteria bacterium]NNJ52123.1 bifunctional dia